MATVQEIAAQLRLRMVHGDYLAGPLPSERSLAAELGCSYLTARRAAEVIIAEGLLMRNANGRLVPALTRNGGAGRHKIVAFLADVYPSSGTQIWFLAVSRAMEAKGARVRMLHFHHWDAPVIREAVRTCDETYLLPCSEKPPAPVMAMLKKHQKRITVLEYDWTGEGFHCVTPYPARACLRLLMTHLKEQGYTRVDAINVQPKDDVVAARIASWDYERRRLGLDGALIDQPTDTGASPYEHANAVLPEILKPRFQKDYACVGITLPAALGAMRGLYQTTFKLGDDVGICSVANEEMAKFLTPGITCIDPIALEDVMAAQTGGFSARRSTPKTLQLYVGPSTQRNASTCRGRA